MSKLDLRSRTTGCIVTFNWSKTGQNYALRRQLWGQFAVRLGGTKLGGSSDGFGLWELPQSVTMTQLNVWFGENLHKADRVAVIFPHGEIRGASAMSVHTHNIQV